MTAREQIIDQRLVNRYPAGGRIAIDWMVADRKRVMRRRPAPPKAVVVDLSVTGMLVEAPADPVMVKGAIVTIGSDGESAVARVAHAHTSVNPEHQLVGLEITRMSDGFAQNLHAAVAALRSGSLPGES